jgi:hypothetical protein
MIVTDGAGPPPQKEGPHHWVRAKSRGSPTTRALLFGKPELPPVQAQTERKRMGRPPLLRLSHERRSF